MLTQSIEVMKYIRASAGRAGISVVFEETNQPRHDGKTIYLPRITGKTTLVELKQLMASVDHEVAHDRFSCFDVLTEKKLDGSSMLMFVWNFLEDSRVNVIEAKEYKGFKENWDECSSSLVADILKRASKETSSGAKLTSSLLCWESHISAAYFPTIELATSRFTPNKKITDVLNNFSDRLISCHQILNKRLGTEATYQLAVDILKELGSKCKEELKETTKPTSTSAVKKEGETTAESTDKTKLGEKESKESKDGTSEEDEYKIIKVKLTKEDLEKFSLTMPQDGASMGKVGINFDPVALGYREWDMTDYKDFIVVNYPKKLGESHYFENNAKTRAFIKEYRFRVSDKLVSQENFAQQVRKLIQIRAKVQTQYGTKRGKLDQSRLSRICFDAPGFNERVFKTRIKNKTLDAAITVLVDMSGSMGGDKAYYALASTLLLNEVCSTLNIPLEIIGFTDGYDSHSKVAPVMFVYKSFSDLKVSENVLVENFSSSSRFMQGNPDGENILWTHDRLIKRKEKKKILVVMSDGSPAASKSSFGLEGFTQKVIEEIQQGKKVDIYGLGLCSDSVKHYYKANDIVSKPEEIPSKLLSLIERKVLSHV
jgi:uncharacterized protein with von Willebrand factor type A (vWA) domain